MKINLNDIIKWEYEYRDNFIQSLSGCRGVHLVGTINSDGRENLSLVNTVVPLYGQRPLVGFILPREQKNSYTYSNIRNAGFFTINHVHKSFFKQAHYASVLLSGTESEFDKCNLTREHIDQFAAPFVKESNLKFGLRLQEEVSLDANNTHFIVGEIQVATLPDNVLAKDGLLDLEMTNDVCADGLNQYYSVSKLKKLSTPTIDSFPDFKVKSRPDNIVFNETSQAYHSHLLPYGTNIGAPKITETGISAWHNSSVTSFNHTFNNKVEALKKNYQQLISEYQLNEMLYKAKISFEPIIGQVYHLYSDDNQDEQFLSLIPPSSWKREHVGSFRLNHDKTWERVDTQ